MEKKLDFKESLNRLDEILETLNDENVSIDESLKLYEEGQKIVKLLEDSLLEAEEKVAKVIETK
jgi:exodeoxyribonuclease VII small subunit